MDMVIYYPTILLKDPGDRLPKSLIKTLCELAEKGWYPTGFGEQSAEGHEDYTELWLSNAPLDEYHTNPVAVLTRFVSDPN